MTKSSDSFLSTRQSLLSRLRRLDDDDSWREFDRIYRRLLYGFGRKAGLSDAEAKDAAQETLISVRQTMPKFEYRPKECSFKGWLRFLAERRINDQLRRRSKEVPEAELRDSDTEEGLDVASPTGAASDSLEALWDAEWQRHLLAVALERLQLLAKARQVQIFHHFVIQGRSARDVCATLGVTLGQVDLAKHRLGPKFRAIVNKIEEQGI